jgi:flagellar protein FliS
MPQFDAYLETQVLTADPMELVRLLYRAAGDATRNARAHLTAGRITERARQISKAHGILAQLSVTLDHTRGGTLSRSLAELYDYMQRQLLDANQRQKAEPLQEVERLLATLMEGWEQIGRAPVSAAYEKPVRPPVEEEHVVEYGGYAAVFESSSPTGYASQNWSF